jgi:hypothetical protein
MALKNIKLKKDANPMKILSDTSAVEMRFKQALSKERKIKIVQACAGDDYAQIIVVTDGIAQIQSQQNATALELCKAMRKLWRIAGHNNYNKEDEDVDDDSLRLETSLCTVKDKQSLVGNQKCFDCGKKGHRLGKCPHKIKKDGLALGVFRVMRPTPPQVALQGQDNRKRLALQQMQALRTPNPRAVTAANQVTRKRTAGRNTCTKPQVGVPRKLWERSWMKNYLCEKLHKTRCCHTPRMT